MSAYRHLTTLADILRAEGLKVVEVDGWRTRGRPASTGGFHPVGVLAHHTATGRSTSDAAVVRLLVDGRPDLPGPLSQLGLARDGTVYVIAAGRANHAGQAKAAGTIAAGDGNALYIGVEAFNDGRGEPWPSVQYDVYVRLCAVLSAKITRGSVQTVRGHKETSVTGKIDPTFDMNKFRERVAAEMQVMQRPKPKPDTEPERLRRGWKPMDVGTWNVGGRRSPRKLAEIVTGILAAEPAFLALQEIGDQSDAVTRILEANPDYRLATGTADLPGSRRDAVLYDTRQATLLEPVVRLLMPRREGDPEAAGTSSTYGPKYAAGGVFRHAASGRTPVVVSVHQVPSLQRPRQRVLGDEFAGNLGAWLSGIRGLRVVAGDLNAQPGHPTLAPLIAAGLAVNHDTLGLEPTFGDRAIDHVWATAGYQMLEQAVTWHGGDHASVVVRGRVRDVRS